MRGFWLLLTGARGMCGVKCGSVKMTESSTFIRSNYKAETAVTNKQCKDGAGIIRHDRILSESCQYDWQEAGGARVGGRTKQEEKFV